MGGALTACPSGAPEFTPDFSVVLVAPSLVLLCSILSFWPFLLITVVLFVLLSFYRCFSFELQLLINPVVSSSFS
jgi:hypothetical protein